MNITTATNVLSDLDIGSTATIDGHAVFHGVDPDTGADYYTIDDAGELWPLSLEDAAHQFVSAPDSERDEMTAEPTADAIREVLGNERDHETPAQRWEGP